MPQLALSQPPPEELIQTQTAVCELYRTATGRGMAAIAMAGVITLGILAMFQKIFWGQAILYAAAIAGAYGSISIASHITERTTFAADCDIQAPAPNSSPWGDDNTDCSTGPCLTGTSGSTTNVADSTAVQDCLDQGSNCSWYPGNPSANEPAECRCNTVVPSCPAGPCPSGSSPAPGDPCTCECQPCPPPSVPTVPTVPAGGGVVCSCMSSGPPGPGGGLTCPGSCPPHSSADPSDPTECDCICDACPHNPGDGGTQVSSIVQKGDVCECTGCPVPTPSCPTGETYNMSTCSCEGGAPPPPTCDSSYPTCEELDSATNTCVQNLTLPGCSCTGNCLDGSVSTGPPACECDCSIVCSASDQQPIAPFVGEGTGCGCSCTHFCEVYDSSSGDCVYDTGTSCCASNPSCPHWNNVINRCVSSIGGTNCP